MNKPVLKRIIAVSAFFCFILTISIGLFLKFGLFSSEGRLRSLANPNFGGFFNLGYHDWAAVHFTAAVIFTVLLCALAALHWDVLTASLFSRRNKTQRRTQAAALAAALLLVVFLFAAPWLSLLLAPSGPPAGPRWNPELEHWRGRHP